MKMFVRIWIAISLLAIAFGIGIMIVIAASGTGWRDIPTFSLNESYDNIDSLDFDINYGSIYIKEGDTFSIDAENLPENVFKSYVSNGTWYIKEEYGKLIHVFGWNFSIGHFFDWDEDNSRRITITIPKDFVAEAYTLSIGAGEVNVETIYAEEGDFNVGAGMLNIKKMVINGKSKYEVGAGSMKIDDFTAMDADIECGIGSIIIDGALKGDNVITCGIGRIKLDLSGTEDDFSYDLEAGLGNVVIDGRSYHSMNKSINNNTDNRLALDCGIGSIDVNFD
jgi:hypothetical protein